VVRTEIPFTNVIRRKLASGKWKEYWRFRRGERNSALPGRPGDPAFHARYAEILAEEERIAADKSSARGTFAWLCEEYLSSVEFTSLAQPTQDDYRYTIDERLRPALGEERFDAINRATIKLVRDNVAKTHSARTAHKVKQMASRLYSWAEEQDLLPTGFVNPAAGIRKLKAKAKPITIWSDEEIALFLGKCEPFMKTPVMLALYTGQRREDLVQMTWKDFQGGIIRVRQNKTDEMLDIPCHPELRKHLEGVRTKFGGAIVRNAKGKPMDANRLSAALNRAVAAIDNMPHRSWHGLRYASAGRLEAAGCSVVEITSIIGHRTYQMAIKYARQRKDAEAAISRLEKSA
jgi:integrase